MDEKNIISYLKNGDLVEIKKIISKGVDILDPIAEAPNETMLGYVISNYGNYSEDIRDEIVLYLIEEEVKVRCSRKRWRNSEWNRYITFAFVYCNSEKVVLKLINTGSANIVDFNIQDCYIYTAIKENYNAEIICTLLKFCSKSKPELLTRLLRHAVSCQRNVDVFRSLANAGANLHTCYYGKGNLFHYICLRCDVTGCKMRQTVDFLVYNGVNIKVNDNESNTVIHKISCPYLIHLAMRHGVSIEHRNRKNFSPLLLAFFRGEVKKANLLLQLGADPNTALIFYLLPEFKIEQKLLHFKYNPINLLLYYGADVRPNKFLKNNSVLAFLAYSTIFTDDLKKIVSNLNFFVEQSDLLNYFPRLDDSQMKFLLLFLEKCNTEINKMKNIFLSDNLTLHNFCSIKKNYVTKYIDVSVSEFEFDCKTITELFPIYSEFINIRIKDNLQKRWHKILRDMFGNNVVFPTHNLGDVLEIAGNDVLDYDCLYYLSKYLNSEDMYKFLLASKE